MKKKKLTYNELAERLDLLFTRILEIERAINYTHSLVIAYVDSNDHSEKFVKFLKEQKEKNEQANGSNIKGNRENKPGDTNTKPESTKTGGESIQRTS